MSFNSLEIFETLIWKIKKNAEPCLTGSRGLNIALKAILEAVEGSATLSRSSIMQMQLRDRSEKGICLKCSIRRKKLLCIIMENGVSVSCRATFYFVPLRMLLLSHKDWNCSVFEKCSLLFWDVFFSFISVAYKRPAAEDLKRWKLFFHGRLWVCYKWC